MKNVRITIFSALVAAELLALPLFAAAEEPAKNLSEMLNHDTVISSKAFPSSKKKKEEREKEQKEKQANLDRFNAELKEKQATQNKNQGK